MKVESPLVTVLMPVYNGQSYLGEAIESILNQSYKNFEFLIINDGSTDKTKEIICSYSDPRIRYVENETNIRLIATLNKGILLANGEYIVRMDADDISLPQRIEKQVAFMESHPAVGVCGSGFMIFGNSERQVRYPLMHKEISVSMLFFNPICHPASIWRTCIIKKHGLQFDPEYLHAEEYKFWIDFGKYAEFANIDQVLLNYREHTLQVSNKEAAIQNKTAVRIRKELFAQFGVFLNDQEMELWEELISVSDHFSNPDRVLLLLEKVVDIAKKNERFDNNCFIRKLAKKWKNALLQKQELSLYEFKLFLHSPLNKANNWTLKQMAFVCLKVLKKKSNYK